MTSLSHMPSTPRAPDEPRASDRSGRASWTNRQRLLTFGAVVLAACGGFWFWHPPPIPDVPRSNLVVRQGRLHRVGQTTPFTGAMVELYPDGALKSRSMIAGGLLHGASEGWHPNGQLAVREHFRKGVSHGLREKWYADGAKMSEVTIVQGKLQGTFRRWHGNGALAEQIEMREGNADGLSLAYYPSGFLKAQAKLEKGKVVEQRFWPDGEHKETSSDTGIRRN